MRLGPLDVRRHPRAAAAPPEKKPKAERGASGTVNLGGLLVTAEYDRELQGHRAIRVWERMLWSDGSVREAVDHIAAPIKNADVEIEPASQDPLDLEVAEFARRLWFEWLDQPWLELLDQALEYLWIGHYVAELVEKVVDDELTYTPAASPDDPKPEPVTLPSRQFLVLDRVAQRLPDTIFKWHAAGGKLTSIVQHAYKGDTWGEFEIPADSLLVLTNRRRGDDFTGQSILRSARKAWVLKELVEKIEAISLERWGVGIPIAYPPEANRDDDALLDRLETLLEDLRAGEFSYIVAPGPKASATRDGFWFEILSPTGTPPDFDKPKAYHRAEIKAAVLARFAELGHASVGARATGDIQSVVWFAALHAVAMYLEQAFSQVTRRYIDLNYTVSEYPTLAISGVEERNLAEFAQGVAQLVSSGAVKADRSFRGWTRQALDAPDEDEDAEEQAEQDEPPVDPNAPKPPPGEPPSPIEKE